MKRPEYILWCLQCQGLVVQVFPERVARSMTGAVKRKRYGGSGYGIQCDTGI